MSLCAIVILKLPDLLSFSSDQVSSRRQLLPCGSLRARRSPAPSFLSLMSIHCSGTLSISKADTAESRTHHRKREAAGAASSDSQERLATCITSESVLHCACHCMGGDNQLKPLSFGSHPFGDVPIHGEPNLKGFFMGALLTVQESIG